MCKELNLEMELDTLILSNSLCIVEVIGGAIIGVKIKRGNFSRGDKVQVYRDNVKIITDIKINQIKHFNNQLEYANAMIGKCGLIFDDFDLDIMPGDKIITI